jgi:hypothetical protein
MLGPEWLIVPVGQPGATSVRGCVLNEPMLAPHLVSFQISSHLIRSHLISSDLL